MRLGLVLAATALVASVAVSLAVVPDAPVSTTAPDAADGPPAEAAPDGRMPTPTTATVTAEQLGEDSVIAVVGRGDFESADLTGPARSLEVITSDGVRHPVYSVAFGGSSRGDFTLADWRPEMQTALLVVSRGRAGATAVAYDVVTGATREIALPKRAISVGLNPDGTGVLMTTYADRGEGSIWTRSWEGVEARLPGSSGGAPITSVDGSTLVTGAAHSRRWWVIDLAARTATALEPPGSCTLIRWLDADSLLTSCYRRGANQLRSIDLDGASAVLGLSHRVKGTGIFLDGDVREVQGRSWHLSHDSCADSLTEQQLASGELRRVKVPGLAASLSLVGVRGDDLLITHYWPELTAKDCGTPRVRPELTLFEPVTRSETTLTRLGWHESWSSTLVATEVRSWNP